MADSLLEEMRHTLCLTTRCKFDKRADCTVREFPHASFAGGFLMIWGNSLHSLCSVPTKYNPFENRNFIIGTDVYRLSK